MSKICVTTGANQGLCEQCLHDSDCVSPLVCNTTTNTCVSPSTDGGASDAAASDAAASDSGDAGHPADSGVTPPADAGGSDTGAATDADASTPVDDGSLEGGGCAVGTVTTNTGTTPGTLALMVGLGIVAARRRRR